MSRRSAGLVAVLVLLASPAHAQSWSLGTHAAISHIRSGEEGSGSTTVTAWPANSLGYQPGLRLAFGTRSHAHEVTLDSGLLLIDEGGSLYSQLSTLFGYQHTFAASAPLAPYAAASIGFFREGGAPGVSSELAYGAGIGVRRTVGERHGCVRAEARFDRLNSDGRTGRPPLTIWGVRLGFDLWFRS